MDPSLYEKNIGTARTEIEVLSKKINTNSLLRLAVIIAGAAILFKLFQLNNVSYVLGAVIVMVIVFLYLVLRQSRLERLRAEKDAFLTINENEIQIRETRKNIYEDGERFDEPKHPYSADLDIFGEFSLFSKINRCATQDGVNILASWLKNPASHTQITERQEAIEELARDTDFLQGLQTKLLFNLGSSVNLRQYLEGYFSGQGMLFGNTFMRMYTIVAPFLIVGGIIFSLLVYNIGNYVLALAIVHLLWTIYMAGKVSVFSNRIDRIGTTMIAFSDAIRQVEEKNFESVLNKKLKDGLQSEDGTKLSATLHELGQLIDKLDVRNNMLVGAILNMVMLWDFRQVLAILRWKNKYQQKILHAFDSMSEMEALASLSILKVNHADWCRPEVMEFTPGTHMTAHAIRHPLIDPKASVANDYIAINHQVALVTGSNMAGKSTFLRTIGINAVLAYAGAPVCAKSLQLPIYRLVTYMRIKDNLNESTSTFKAELDRMKFILGVVEVAKDSFFLIDEMLRGTNSVDKYLGSKAIIKKLIEMDGQGMVATHDLQLSKLADEYPDALENYHFDIQIQDGEMLFDYKLKDGECKIFNASLLLKGIGVEVSGA